jgi:DNA-binding beta-propeller fold protein YncE
MDETKLRGLLAEALTDEPPMGPVTQPALRAGLRIRRRRRLLAASGGMATIAAASLGLTSISLAGGPPAPSAPAALSPVEHTIWTTNDHAGTLMTITHDGQLGSPIQIGHDMSPVVFSPDGKTLAVISYATYNLVTVDVATGAVSQRIKVVGKYADAIAITPDDQTAYTASFTDNTVTPYDLAQGTAGTPINVGAEPRAIAITPDGRTMYVLSKASAQSSQSEVTPITIATGKAGPPIPVGKNSVQMAISPDGKTLLVANGEQDTVSDGSVTLIDTATNTAGKPLAIGHVSAAGAAFSPGGQTAYVVNSGTGTLVPIDLATQTAGKPIRVSVLENPGGPSADPLAVAITPDGKTAYVLTPSLDPQHSSVVTPVDTATGTAGKPIPVPGMAESIAVSPDGQTVYVGGYRPGILTPISTSTNQAGPVVQAGKGAQITVFTGP